MLADCLFVDPPMPGTDYMPLEIPDRDRRRLELIARLSRSELSELYSALSASEPALGTTAFASKVAERSKLDPTILVDIVRFLQNLYWVTVDEELEPEFIAGETVRNAIDANIDEPSEGWDQFKAFLVRFLTLHGTLGIASKAMFVAAQYSCHFHASRVMTDARPIFGIDPSQPPAAFVLSHTLSIDVHTADDGDKELFIALDGEDLIALRATIDRALAKEKSLRGALTVTSVPILSNSGIKPE
jgi:hypothetical protein